MEHDIEQNKRLVLAFAGAINARDVDALDDLVAVDLSATAMPRRVSAIGTI